jgi:hypothetical protein
MTTSNTEGPGDDGGSDGPVRDLEPIDLNELALFDPASVPVTRRTIQGFAVAPPGLLPLEMLDAFSPDSPYGLYGLSSRADYKAFKAFYLAEMAKSTDASLVPLILSGELRLDVHYFASTPVPVADMTAHPFLWRAPILAENLHRTGTPHAASASVEWQTIRKLVDYTDIGAIEVPPQSGSGGHDFLVRRRHADTLEFKRLGRLSEVLPTVDDTSAVNAVQGLIRALGRIIPWTP